ncbi:MAG: TonB-dependent receptor [Gemmatimonadetes bacterium]|nr:TonB-dependent receptor [Gemmatimonadota bacterium]
MAAVPVAAQESAIVEGVVRAQVGFPIANVTVRLDPDGPASRTDGSGRFILTIPAGSVATLTFDRDGYRSEQLSIPALSSGQRRQVGIILTALYSLDAVSVVAERERPLLNTANAATGGAVERLELASLPTDSRDPLALAFTIPGVSQSTGFFGDAPPLTINGANSLYTQYLVDGLDNNEGFLGGPRVQLPLAGIARFGVLTSSYGAEVGRSSTGVVDVETRAGAEQWSGEWFVFGRPGTPFDANPKFTPPGTDPDGFRRVQAGGAVGGPVVAGRTFVFATVEYSNEREDRIGSTARTQFLGTELRDTWKVFSRLDHGWTPRQTTTLRFAVSDLRRTGQGGGVIVPEADITTIRRGSITALTHRSSMRGSTAANTFSAQLGTFRWDFPPSLSDLRTPQVTIVSPDLTTVEAVVGSSNFIFDESELQIQLRDVFQLQWGGRHTLRFGGDVSRSGFELLGSSTNPLGAYTVVNDGNIAASGAFVSIRDVPANVRVIRYSIDANPQQVNLSQTLVGAFVENEWRVSPDLTVNLGLRWDYDDITSRGESRPDLDNIQPRVSFSWLAAPTRVLRGGAGVYTGKLPYAVYSDAVQFGPDGNALVTLEGAEFPPPSFGGGPSAGDLQTLRDRFPPREIRRMFALGLEQPESYQLSLGYQQQLTERWGFSVDGVWVETRKLPRSWDLNAIVRAPIPADTVDRPAEFGDQFRPVQPEPGSFRRLTTTESGGMSSYWGLHTTMRSRVTERFSMEGSWVWSRTQNDTEDINFNATSGNDFAAEWADAVNDRRHHVTLRGAYRLADRLRLGGIADYQTGTPINRVAFFRDLTGSGAIFGNGFIGNHDRFPGVPRNAERLPDALQLSASVAVLLPIQRSPLELRADVFNLLNSRVISGFANGIPGGGPRTQVGRPGDPFEFTTAGPPRQLQLSARYIF